MKTKRKEKEKKSEEKERREAKRKRLCPESNLGPSTHRAKALLLGHVEHIADDEKTALHEYFGH